MSGNIEFGPFLSSLNNLTHLELSSNKFSALSLTTDRSPPSTSLSFLNLSSCLLQNIDDRFGSIFAKTLQIIDFSQNSLDLLPLTFSQLDVIEFLDLSENVRLQLPQGFWNMTSLRSFRFDFGTLQGVPSQISQWKDLEVFSVAFNKLTSFPTSLVGLTSLRRVNLNGNRVGSIPPELIALQNLSQFECRGCSLRDFPTLNISGLQTLYLSDNDIPLVDLSRLINLKQISLQIESVIPSSLKNFTSLESVTFSGSRFRELPDLPPSISFLTLINSSVSFWPDSYWNGLPLLALINVDRGLLPLEFPYFFLNSEAHQKIVNLDGPFTGTLPCSFPKTLRLSLASSQVTGSLCSDLSSSSELQSLILQNNPLITGHIPSELLILSNLTDIVLKANHFDSLLPIEFAKWSQDVSNLSRCVLDQPQSPFFCESERLLGEDIICDIRCLSRKSLAGIWLNDDQPCHSSFLGLKWTKSKIEIFPNGTGSSVVEYHDGCGYAQDISVKLEGTFEVENQTQISEQEYLINVSFKVSAQSAFIYSTKANVWFRFACGLDLSVGQWADLSHTNCHTSLYGLTGEFYNLELCPLRYDTWLVNFQTSTLTTGQGVFMGLVRSTSSCSATGAYRPELNEDVQLRRNWKCQTEELATCLPDCGDDFAFGNEQCDDGNVLSWDGCSSECLTEVGWSCPGEGDGLERVGCEPICGDHLIVSQFDCDSIQTSTSNQNSKSLLWLISCVGIVFLACGVIWYFFKLKKVRNWEIPADQLQLESVLGEGNFGKVYRASWRGNTTVAVKFLKNDVKLNKQELDDFTREAELFKKLPPHPNIVQFLGVCLHLNSNFEMRNSGVEDGIDQHPKLKMKETSFNSLKSEFGIVTEFLGSGNLVEHLQSNLDCESEQSMAQKLQLRTLIDLGKGISAGMDHLHQNRIIHRDLAARNILIHLSWERKSVDLDSVQKNFGSSPSQDQGNDKNQSRIIPKISDFGLSGTEKRRRKIAIRWASPELLVNSRIATEKSDVWAFGVVMYEICVACHFLPYAQLKTNTEVREFVLSGNQLSFPRGLPVQCEALFKACLSYTGALRPEFGVIHQQLYSFEEETMPEDLNRERGIRNENEAENVVVYEVENVDVFYS